MYKNPLHKKHVVAWSQTASALSRIKIIELRDIDVQKTLLSLLPAFEHAIKLDKEMPDEISGLVQQQQLFRKLTKNESSIP